MYSDEQLKKIAEWLPMWKSSRVTNIRPFYFVGDQEPDWCTNAEFTNWLHSPEGQAAVMDRLEKYKDVAMIQNEVARVDERLGRYITIYRNNDATPNPEAFAETRQEALIAAVLGMLEKQ